MIELKWMNWLDWIELKWIDWIEIDEMDRGNDWIEVEMIELLMWNNVLWIVIEIE